MHRRLKVEGFEFRLYCVRAPVCLAKGFKKTAQVKLTATVRCRSFPDWLLPLG